MSNFQHFYSGCPKRGEHRSQCNIGEEDASQKTNFYLHLVCIYFHECNASLLSLLGESPIQSMPWWTLAFIMTLLLITHKWHSSSYIYCSNNVSQQSLVKAFRSLNHKFNSHLHSYASQDYFDWNNFEDKCGGKFGVQSIIGCFSKLPNFSNGHWNDSMEHSENFYSDSTFRFIWFIFPSTFNFSDLTPLFPFSFFHFLFQSILPPHSYSFLSEQLATIIPLDISTTNRDFPVDQGTSQ